MEKEDLLMKLIMENGGTEIDHILNSYQNPRLVTAKSLEDKIVLKKGQSVNIQNAKLEI